jgi:hypothetical protein
MNTNVRNVVMYSMLFRGWAQTVPILSVPNAVQKNLKKWSLAAVLSVSEAILIPGVVPPGAVAPVLAEASDR